MKYILLILVLSSIAMGLTFTSEYYSQQKFYPKTASWNDPIGMFMGEVYFIVEHRDMSDPNRLKVKGPGKIWFGDDDDDDFWLGWDDPNDMGFYGDDSGQSVFHFGTDANTVDVDLDGDLDVKGDTLIGGTLGVTGQSTLSGIAYPTDDGDVGDVMTLDSANTLAMKTPTVGIPICLSMYDAEPARASETNWNGGMYNLATAQPLDSVPTDLVVNKGIGKLLIVINAASDFDGDITITGESIDRNTGASTPADTDLIHVDTLTTDTSDADTNTNVRHGFTNAYISSKWFTGTVTLSTADLTLTDVDVWHISFEQFNDQPNITLDSFDVNLFTTGTAAEFDAYLYSVHVTGSKAVVERHADLHIGADGETAITNRYWRLRRGDLDDAIDGTTDGIWADVFYSNTPAQIEDVTLKVWATETKSLTLQ